jgi:hypothetical protein
MAKKPATPKYKPGDTRKSKTGKTLRLSSTGKWFQSSTSPAADKQRALNTRLNSPISSFQTPAGTITSPTTERDLAHEADAASTVKYGTGDGLKQALAQAVQHQTNVGSYYDDYRTQLQSLQGQAQAYNAGALQAMQALPGMVTGLAQGTQNQVQQNQAARGPEMGAIGATTTAQNASNAAATSQAAAGSYAAQQALVGNANTSYAANLANNVAPAAKIQAVQNAQGGITKAQGDINDFTAQKGAYNQSYRDQRRTDERKTLAAEATFGLDSQKAAATAQANSPAAKAANTQVTNDARVAANHGYSLHNWRLLGPTRRNQIINADKKKSTKDDSKTIYPSGPFVGHTHGDVAGMTQAQRDALVAKGQKGGKGGKGPAWVKPEEQTTAEGKAVRSKSTALNLRSGHEISIQVQDPTTKKMVPKVLNKNGTKLNRTQAADFLRKNTSTDEAMISAALDAAYNNPPHLSAYTVRKLIAAGYKPSSVARTLNVKTPGQGGSKALKPTGPGSNTNYGGGAGAGSGTS